MIVLGIGHDIWISSAAIVRDGEVIAAACEERLNRQKRSKAFPAKSIDVCLDIAGIDMADVDLVVTGWNPSHHLEGLHGRFSGTARFRPEYLYAVPNYVLQKAQPFPLGVVEERFEGFRAPIVHLDHQLAHAANAFYLSPFEHAAVFTADGRGERQTTLFAEADSTGITSLGSVMYPHSIGLFYGLITQYLGFVPDGDEWKVMALASHGRDGDTPYYRLLRDMFRLLEDGSFLLDESMCGFQHFEVYGGRFYTPEFMNAVGFPPRTPSDPIVGRHVDLAHAVQRVFEEVMGHCLTRLYERTGVDKLAAAGGCFMNSVFNGRVTACTPFKELFVSSCPDDSGISVGAALWGYHIWGKGDRRVPCTHNFWGPQYDSEILPTLQRCKVPFKRLLHPEKEAARLIADGKLVGW
ncbi:MAG: carbamoyltransferase N-terminal domain-containing protein, partial [Pseudomonadota bacterium]